MTGQRHRPARPGWTRWFRVSRSVKILTRSAVLTAGLAVTATGVAAAGTASAGAARPAASHAITPAAVKYCGKTRVTVIVDFTHFKGGKIRSGCASSPKTGLAALSKAGFSYSFVPRVPGFVCRIDRKPDKCNGAPTSAYWSYWHAKPHGKWQYSSRGAGGYRPKKGWIEGWSFGKGKPPHTSAP